MSKKAVRNQGAESTDSTAAPQFDFEAALEQLEQLVSSMEEGDLSLEESLQSFEKGIKLTRECQSALSKAEQKVQKLMDDAGTTEPLAFDDEDD
ncbi:MAG: exodeoxyribonuclease VII small subunit [Gammaproteobacteria bacterium]|nr:exodeoxyribonuclease VII small subunit [Gammaproteobacteria bacterium]